MDTSSGASSTTTITTPSAFTGSLTAFITDAAAAIRTAAIISLVCEIGVHNLEGFGKSDGMSKKTV